MGAQTFSSTFNPSSQREKTQPYTEKRLCQLVKESQAKTPSCPPPWQKCWRRLEVVWKAALWVCGVAALRAFPGRSSPSPSHGSHLLIPACPYPCPHCLDMLLHHPPASSSPASSVLALLSSSTQIRELMARVGVLLLCLSHGMALPQTFSRSPTPPFPEDESAGEQDSGAQRETSGCQHGGSFYFIYLFLFII